MLYLCINKIDKVMKSVTFSNYCVRPICDSRDLVKYYEFVRISDDAILRSSISYSFIVAFAEGFCNAKNTSFIIL